MDLEKTKKGYLSYTLKHLLKAVEAGEILDFKIEVNKDSNVIDVTIVPKAALEFIDMNFVVTPTGTKMA